MLSCIVNCAQQHKATVYFLGSMQQGDVAYLVAYTFGLQEVASAAQTAARRGGDVRIVADKRELFSGRTAGMIDLLDQCQRAGCRVFLATGTSVSNAYAQVGRYGPSDLGVGICHAKTFAMCKGTTEAIGPAVMLLGSANWTTSSRCNLEMGVLLTLTWNGWFQFRMRFDAMTETAVRLDDTAVSQAKKINASARSVSPKRTPIRKPGA